MNLVWKVLYDDGATIEEISLDYGVSLVTVRKALHALGTNMRPAGSRPGVASPSITTARTGHGEAVHLMFAGSRLAHRRRGGKRRAA